MMGFLGENKCLFQMLNHLLAHEISFTHQFDLFRLICGMVKNITQYSCLAFQYKFLHFSLPLCCAENALPNLVFPRYVTITKTGMER